MTTGYASRTELLKAINTHIRANLEHPFVSAISTKDEDGEATEGEDGEVIDVRYFVYEVPEGVKNAFPYAVSSIVSEVDAGAITSSIGDFQWQMAIFGITITDVNMLGDHCRDLFGNVRLKAGSTCFSCRYASMIGGIRDASADPWMTAVTFNVYG